MISALFDDFRQAGRIIARNPAQSLFHVGLLATVVSVVALSFNVYEVFFLRPAAVRDPARLYRLTYDVPNVGIRSGLSALGLNAIAQNALVEGVAGYMETGGLAITDNLGVFEVRAEAVTLNYFSLLGVRLPVGRALGPEDDERSGEIPIVISHRFWRQRYGQDASVIGRRVTLNRHPARIIGVTEMAFNGFNLDTAADVRFPGWGATRIYADMPEIFGPDALTYDNLIRFRPGAEPKRAADELWALAFAGEKESAARQPGFFMDYLDTIRLSPHALAAAAVGQSRFRHRNSQALHAFLVAAGLLFLLVAANLGGLWLARAVRREAEMAVRLAMGAGHGRLVRQTLAEAILLGSAAAAFAVLLISQAAPFVPMLLPPVRVFGTTVARPIAADFSASPAVLATAVAAAFLATILLACAPSLAIVRLRPIEALKRLRVARGWAGQRVFLVVQVALSTALVVGSLLAAFTLRNLTLMDLGFEAERVAVFDLNPPVAGYTGAQSDRLEHALAARVETLPGVRGVAFGGGLLDGSGMLTSFYPAGTQISQNDRMNTSVSAASPGFFRVIGQAVIAGREFSPDDDNRHKPSPVLVNESYARKFLGAGDPIGNTIGLAELNKPAPADKIVVGVVSDAQFRSMRQSRPPIVYNLWRYHPDGPGSPDPGYALKLYVRTDGDPQALFEPVRRIARDLAPDVPLTNASTLLEQRDLSLRTDSLTTGLSMIFTLLAFLVAGLGIFSLLSQMVAARTKEMGIRIAMGAQWQDVFRLVLLQAFLVATAGLALGLALAILWFPTADDLFRGVSSRDPLILAAGASLVFGMAFLSALLPARRAARLQPVQALRED